MQRFLVLKQVFHGVTTLLQRIKFTVLKTTSITDARDHKNELSVTLFILSILQFSRIP